MTESEETEAVEIHREEWTGEATNCIVCGKRIQLYWNGGELGEHTCCGHVYALEHVRTDLTISKVSTVPGKAHE